MRLIVFLFLAAFLVSGLVRYSRAAAPASVPAQMAMEAPRSLVVSPGVVSAAPMSTQTTAPTAAPGSAEAQPAPQVLRQKKRHAKAALRAIQKTSGREPPLPPRRMTRLAKTALR